MTEKVSNAYRAHHIASKKRLAKHAERLNIVALLLRDMAPVARDPDRLGIAYNQLVIAHSLILTECSKYKGQIRRGIERYPELKDVD